MIVLGSTSARRAQILSYFSLPFEVRAPAFDEASLVYQDNPQEYAIALAQNKAFSISCRDQVIITADTIVEKEGVIFGKPKDERDAWRMLKALNGTWHTVYTAICARKNDLTICEAATSHIQFHHATDAQLNAYLASLHGIDKAGGYGIQEAGGILVKKIEGCFYNVMGLPISELVTVLAYHGIDLWQYLKL